MNASLRLPAEGALAVCTLWTFATGCTPLEYGFEGCRVDGVRQWSDTRALANCTCSDATPDCWGIHQGRFEGASGTQATLGLKKWDNAPAQIDLKWWLYRTDASQPDCSDPGSALPSSLVATGRWPEGAPSVHMAVSMWTSAEFASLPEQDERHFYFVTDGSDAPGEPRWFQPIALELWKSCDR